MSLYTEPRDSATSTVVIRSLLLHGEQALVGEKKLRHGVFFSLFHLQILNKWIQNYLLGLKLKQHEYFFSCSIQFYAAMVFYI